MTELNTRQTEVAGEPVEPLAEVVMPIEPVAWVYINEDGACEQIEYGPLNPAGPTDTAFQPLYASKLAHPDPALAERVKVLEEALRIAYDFARIFNRRSDSAWANAEDRIWAALKEKDNG